MGATATRAGRVQREADEPRSGTATPTGLERRYLGSGSTTTAVP